jgi:uncharacterized protein (DUF1015 family)
MATVRPFAAFRPPTDIARDVASPPYDVIDTREARALAEGNPASFLHVSRPEIDLPVGVDEHSDAVYAQGAKNLRDLVERGALKQDGEPHLYLYAQKWKEHRQVGIVGCVTVAEYQADLIKKHEKTRPDKEDDRTRHIEELGAHDEPVFLTYRADARIDAFVADAMKASPVYDFATKDGVEHKFWVISRAASNEISSAFEKVAALYVADGHHRCAAAARVHQLLRGDGAEHDAFLAVVFPDVQMKILPYNRVVRDLAGRSNEAILEALRDKVDLVPVANGAEATPTAPKTFGIYLDKRWYRATVRPGSFDAADPVKALDCSICQDQILGPIFGVADPRVDKHVEFVGGIRGYQELELRVDERGNTLAIQLYPTQIEELFDVSDKGLLMPPKSTWFEPKLRSGLFVHTF